jgi:hypothetical protein
MAYFAIGIVPNNFEGTSFMNSDQVFLMLETLL